MNLEAFVRSMPKVELHVHLEGSVRPETVLELAKKNAVALPADSLEGLRAWYTYRDFPHFVEIYVAISQCIRTADDLELIAREFLEEQARQNILYSEVTFTASTIEKYHHIPWPEQLAAINRARSWAAENLGVSMSLILDIVRGDPPERGLEVARWAVESMNDGVCALGLAGEEWVVPAGAYTEAYEYAHSHGLPITPHAGETRGPESIRECLDVMRPMRIGHGVRCLEDPALVQELRSRKIPLEVCPTSNVRLGVFPSLSEHPIRRMMDAGLYVTINSDDPPMFNTTLTDELLSVAATFDLDADVLLQLQLNAAKAAFLPAEKKSELLRRISQAIPASKLG